MLEQIMEYRYFILAILFLIIVLITVFLIIKKEKVKPIDMEEVEQENNKKTSIEEVLEAMESTVSERPMTTFEQEQEDNAIISYQELVKAVNEKKSNSEFKPTTIEAPVETQEIINDIIKDNTNQEIETLDDNNEEVLEEEPVVKENRRFKNSEFISPIFGKDNNSNDNFLKELKDLRKNL